MQFLLVKDKSGLSSNKKSKIKKSFIDTNSILCDYIEYEWESEDNTMYFIGRNPDIHIYKQYDVFNTDNNGLTFIHGWVKKEDKDHMLTAKKINNEVINENELDGYYSIGKIDSKGFGNFYRSLFSPVLYYSNSEDGFALSNRVSTLSELLNYKKINKKHIAAHIGYLGRSLSFGTMFENIYHIPSGTKITISDNIELKRIYDFLYDKELENKYDQNEEEYWDECHKKISSQVKAFSNLGIENNLELGITGGKDSRLLLSFFYKHLSSTWTWGPAYSPEVIVGRMCSEKLKLNHAAREMRESSDPENLMKYIPGHLFNTEFERSPWDLHRLLKETNDKYNIDGQELIKGIPYKEDMAIEDILDNIDKVYDDNNTIVKEQNKEIKTNNHEISREYLNNIHNLNKFPILERIVGYGRWSSITHDYRFSNSFVIGLLLTNTILKYNYNCSIEDVLNLKIHYELTKRNCPDLLEIPLFDAEFEQVKNFAIENKIPAKLNNKALFLVRYLDFLKDYILENYDLISDIVKKNFVLDLNKEDLLKDSIKGFILYELLQLIILQKYPDFKDLKYLDLDLPEISAENIDTYDNDCVLAFVNYNEDIVRLKKENMRLKKENNENNKENIRLKAENNKNNKENARLKEENKKLNATINELITSNSWKITKPLRKLRHVK
ncbi:hypothetical protein [Methanobacterium oryzae]|uniref:hypothetical protein n=1 Tax=Methanobacterium oryzae TaxID=69540 RepID=UPI003D1CC319